MKKITITFIDSSVITVESTRTIVDDGILRIRTSHSSAYYESWTCFPIVNVRSWSYS